MSDPRLVPFIKAIGAVDRTHLGFSPISTNARVQLDEGAKMPCDALLHIYADTSRTVAFRKMPGGYRWIAETEEHYGPKNYTNIDGTLQEELVVSYQAEQLDGTPTNQIRVAYYGEDKRLAGRDDLTLEAIKPILEEWKGTQIR
jgi:hypothetical protein